MEANGEVNVQISIWGQYSSDPTLRSQQVKTLNNFLANEENSLFYPLAYPKPGDTPSGEKPREIGITIYPTPLEAYNEPDYQEDLTEPKPPYIYHYIEVMETGASYLRGWLNEDGGCDY